MRRNARLKCMYCLTGVGKCRDASFAALARSGENNAEGGRRRNVPGGPVGGLTSERLPILDGLPSLAAFGFFGLLGLWAAGTMN